MNCDHAALEGVGEARSVQADLQEGSTTALPWSKHCIPLPCYRCHVEVCLRYVVATVCQECGTITLVIIEASTTLPSRELIQLTVESEALWT